MKTIKVYNSRTCEMKELGSQLGVEGQALMIDMSGKYIVYQNDVGYVIMSEKRVIEYAKNLLQANPDVWERHTYLTHGIDEIHEAVGVIENTLDNETVYEIESQV